MQNKKKSLYVRFFTMHLLYLFNTHAMNFIEKQKIDEQKSPETPVLTPNFLTTELNHIPPTRKKRKQLEQAFGKAILKQDTQAISDLVKDGININKHFRYSIKFKKGEKQLLHTPLVFALIFADKNNYNTLKTLITLGANIECIRKPSFHTRDKKIKENIEMVEKLYFELKQS